MYQTTAAFLSGAWYLIIHSDSRIFGRNVTKRTCGAVLRAYSGHALLPWEWT